MLFYRVGHLFLLFPCGILFVLSEVVCCIQGSIIFLLLYMWFGFSTLKVNTLSVYCCKRWFLFWRSFRINVVFPFVIHSGMLASSRYLLSCWDNMSWVNGVFFITRTHVYHHGLVFSNLLHDWVLLFVSSGVCSQLGLGLVILFLCYLSFRRFCYALSVPVSYSQTVLFLFHPVLPVSFYFLHRLAGRIFFHYF